MFLACYFYKNFASKIVASNSSYFDDFEHVKIFSSCFTDFEQVKIVNGCFTDFEQ